MQGTYWYYFKFDKCLPLSSCKLASPSSLRGWNFFGFPERHFDTTSTCISSKFWKLPWIINELAGAIRKLFLALLLLLLLLLLLVSVSSKFQAHAPGGKPRVKLTLSRASELILAITIRHSTRVTFARAIACSHVTSRNFLSNAICNTESFLGTIVLFLPRISTESISWHFLKRNAKK